MHTAERAEFERLKRRNEKLIVQIGHLQREVDAFEEADREKGLVAEIASLKRRIAELEDAERLIDLLREVVNG